MDEEKREGSKAPDDVFSETFDVEAVEEPASASDLMMPSMSEKLVSRVKGTSPGDSLGGEDSLVIRSFLIRDSFFKEGCEREPVGE